MQPPTQYMTKIRDDGTLLDVIPLSYGRARINLGDKGNPLVYNDNW